MLYDFKQKAKLEIEWQFLSISRWLKELWELDDIMNINSVLWRKNFLIIAIYSANEFILEYIIELFFSKIYDVMESELWPKYHIQFERQKLKKYITDNHSSRLDSIEDILCQLIGNVQSKWIFNSIEVKMGKDYSILKWELIEFKWFRDKIAHSSKNFFSDPAGSQFKGFPNAVVTKRLDRMQLLLISFSDFFYDELWELFIPNEKS